MRLYIESNFILELALEQEQSAAARALLQLAEDGKMELVYPSLSVMEPFSRLTYQALERRRLRDGLESLSLQLARSWSHDAQRTRARVVAVIQQVETLDRQESGELRAVCHLVVRHGLAVGLTDAILTLAEQEHLQGDLRMPDAIVLASVLIDLQARPTADCIFASRDKRAFSGLKARLAAEGCVLLHSFEDTLQRVQAILRNRAQ